MKTFWILLATLSLLATACGGSTTFTVDDQRAGAGGDADPEESADGNDGEPTDDDQADRDESDASSSSDNSPAGGGDFCGLAIEREVAEDAFNDVNFFEPDELRSAFEANRDLLKKAVDAAPAEIRDDLELVRAELDSLFATFESVDFDATQMADLDVDESAESDEAGGRIDDYIENVCGIDRDDNEDGGPTDEELLEQAAESGASVEIVRQALEEAGLTAAQAACLAQQLTLDDFVAFTGEDPPIELLDVFTDCGVSIQELALLGGATLDDDDLPALPDDLPAEALDIFVNELVRGGFTEDEAICLAGAMFGAADTAGDMIGSLEACEIPLSRLAQLGQASGG